MEGLEPIDKMGLIKIHVLLGLTVFILSIFRSWLFFKAPRTDDLKTGSKFNDKLAVWVHNAFYFLLFLISLSGIGTLVLGGYSEAIRSGAIELIKSPEEIPPLTPHHLLAVAMMALLVMHAVGVIKHYLLIKENTLKRMF